MGIGDFISACYAYKIAPNDLNNLLLALREVPTTDIARFEQNRLDGLTLASTFDALRDFIHDQRPNVHAVLTAIVDYYDTGDKSALEKLLPLTDGYLSPIERQKKIYDRTKYELELEGLGKEKCIKI